MNIAANPFRRGTFNLTLQCRLFKFDPTEARRLQAEAKADYDPRKVPPRRLPPVTGAYVPLLGIPPLRILTAEPQEEPAPLPPRMTIIVRPAVDDALRVALLHAVAAVREARSDTFPGGREVLEALACLKDASDDYDPSPVRVFPAAADMLVRYRDVAGSAAANLAGRLAALLHVAKYGAESTAPLNGETLDLPLRVVEWHRRVTAPAKVPAVPEPTVLDIAALHHPAPSTPAPEAPATLIPEVEHGAGEPPQPAGGDPGDVQRLKALLAANAARPLTARDAGRKLKLSAARIREIIAANPGMFRVSEHGTQPSGGRPSQHLALVGPAV